MKTKKARWIIGGLIFWIVGLLEGKTEANFGGLHREFSPCAPGNGRAVAFSPESKNIFYTLWNDTRIFITDPNNTTCSAINTGIVFGALAYDGKRKRLWGAGYDYGHRGGIYLIDSNGASSLQFSFIPNETTCLQNQYHGYFTGLSYDEGPTSSNSDDSLWLVDNDGKTIYHMSLQGNLISSSVIPKGPRTGLVGCANGIASDRDFLWITLISGLHADISGIMPFDIVKVRKSDPSTIVESFSADNINNNSPIGIAIERGKTIPGRTGLWVNFTGGNNIRLFEADKITPVILVNGFSGNAESFGQMAEYLALDGFPVYVFDYGEFTGLNSDISIEEIAALFAGYVNDVLRVTGTGQVDIVVHSMGGLVARAWIAGLATVPVKYTGQIRRMITLGTLNYGAVAASIADLIMTNNSPIQGDEMALGSNFLLNLHKNWMALKSSGAILPDILFVAGTSGIENTIDECGGIGCSDQIVDITSAIMPDAPANMVRYVPYIHAHIMPLPFSPTSIAEIDSKDHASYRIAKAFLDDVVLDQCCDSASIGYTPPHERNVPKEKTGTLIFQLIDKKALTPILGKKITIKLDRAAKAALIDINSGTAGVTILNLPEGLRKVTVSVKGRKNIILNIAIKAAYPIVISEIAM